MKKGWKMLLGMTLIALLDSPSLSDAEMVGSLLFKDSFNKSTMVDMIKTTANVETSHGWIDLACDSEANTIATSAQNGSLHSIVAVTRSGIQWFSQDQFTGKMVQMKSLTLTSYPGPLGIALAPDNTNTLFVYGKDSGEWYIRQALFDGAGLVNNPKMSLNLSSPLAGFTAINGTTFATADKEGNITVYNYDSTSQSLQIDSSHSFATGLTDIVSVRSIPNTYDYYVVTKNEAYRYSYDQASGIDVINPGFTVSTALSNIAGDGYGSLLSLINGTTGNVYGYDQASYQMTPMGNLSISSLVSAFDVSMPTDTTEVIASKGGTVDVYQYDPASNQMVANQALQITGLNFALQCLSPGIYQSESIVTPGQNNMLKVVPTEQNDAGTSISYSLSDDGGSTFTSVIPNTWVHMPEGSRNPPIGGNVPVGPFVIQSQLNSPIDGQTPRLTNVELYGYLDVTLPTAPGQPTANPNPSGGTSTMITWTPSDDPIQPPSTGASGVSTYLIRFSNDGGNNWSDWQDTRSTHTTYSVAIPPNTSEMLSVQVEAMDSAGNISSTSQTGNVFVDTKPLKEDLLQVSSITAPGQNQTASLPTSPPVYVQTGGGAMIEIQTEGAAQSVEMQILGNVPPTMYTSNPVKMVPSSPPQASDQNTWIAQYIVPQTWLDGAPIPNNTPLKVQFRIVGLNGQEIQQTVTIVITDGSVMTTNSGTKSHLG